MRLYNLLLHLYPASFRHEYAGEMRAVFRDQRRHATGIRVPALWLGTIGEIAGNAARVHLGILRQDLGYTARVLRRSPSFALTSILIVALGIGATTAAFSVTDFVLFRPLPFPEPERLVTVWSKTPGYERMELSPPNYRDLSEAVTSFESIGVHTGRAVTMLSHGEAERVQGEGVSAHLFSTLGVMPAIGRPFTADDDRAGAPGTVIVSHRFWQRRFGGDRDALGRVLLFDNVPYTVIGVMPPEFQFPSSQVLFWITNRFPPRAPEDSERVNNAFRGVGRLRRGVTIEQARAELQRIAAQLERQYPTQNKDTSATAFPISAEVPERSRLILLALLGAAGCVLLIACANLASLLLTRALARHRELAVRTALGAGRERLARQLMTESLLIAGAGGTLGIAIAVFSVPLLARLVPANLPIAAAPSVDLRVLLFAIGLTILTGIVFGLAPILRVNRGGHLEGLREGPRAGGGQKERLRAALVVAEIAASVALLVCAGLLLRALISVRAIDPGFTPEGVLTLRTELPFPEYRTVAARDVLYTTVLQNIRQLPGVTSAALVSYLPMSSFRGGIWPASLKGEVVTRSADNVASLRYVTPGYFETMAIPLTRGRDISDADTQDRPFVAVVSESFVRRHWPGEDPIGRRFTFALAEREVVGVAGDVLFRGLERTSEPQVYLSAKQVNDGAILFYAPKSLAIRTTGSPAALAPAVREIIRQADARLPIFELQTLADMVGLETATRVVQVRVLVAFAAIAFGLAAIGIHGLLSYAVSQRVNEIGVRIALGAQSRDILRMVLRRSVVLAGIGVAAGMVIAYGAGRSMEAMLAGVPAADARTFAGAIALSLIMTVLGALAPTRRALRIDPITALRME
jgi:putative ABC transport system permease protein